MLAAHLNLLLLVLAVRPVDAGDYVSLVQHRVERVALPKSLAAGFWKENKHDKTSRSGTKRHRDVADPIVDSVQLNFSKATLGVNNLGGKGPDADDDGVIEIKKVTVYGDQTINMIIEPLTSYNGNVEMNQLRGGFIQLNFQENTSTDLKATFVDDATGLPVLLPDFTLSFWDVNKNGIENIAIAPIIAYYVTRETEIRVQEVDSSFMAFQGSTRTTSNPANMRELSENQLMKGFEVELATTSEVYIRFHGTPDTGRTLYIGGQSPLSETGVRNHVGACKKQNEIQVADPLGVLPMSGKSHDKRLGDVLTVDGKKVDVVVEFADNYRAHNESKNGVYGSNFMINVADNLTTDVTFRFVDPATNRTMLVPDFAFSILDVDGTKSGYEKVRIRKSADMHYWVSSTSSVNVTEGDSEVSFKSTVFGDFSNNPLTDGGLTQEQIDNTVVIWYDEPIPSVTMSLTTYKIWTGRTFEIGMASRVLCPMKFHWEPENPCEDTSTDLIFDSVEVIKNDIRGEGILITEVGFAQSTRIDLIITADDSYRAWNESKNGVSGGFLNLNVADGVKTKITFKFVEHGTTKPFPIKKFFLTILDLDGTRVGRERVGMRTQDFTTYFRHPMTDVSVDEKENYTIFNSASFGSKSNNPNDRETINEGEHRNSVSMYFKEPTDKVEFTLEAENAWTGRNFMFAGNTKIACNI